MFINVKDAVATPHDLCNSFFTICCNHAFILCYYCNMLSGIALEIACPETLHRSGCFDSRYIYIYIYNIFSWLCIVYFLTWSSYSLLLFGGKGWSDDFTGWSRRFRSETLEGRCFITCFYKLSAMKTYSHSVMSFGQVSDHYNSYFVCYHWI